jgi:hypothetical protein
MTGVFRFVNEGLPSILDNVAEYDITSEEFPSFMGSNMRKWTSYVSSVTSTRRRRKNCRRGITATIKKDVIKSLIYTAHGQLATTVLKFGYLYEILGGCCIFTFF